MNNRNATIAPRQTAARLIQKARRLNGSRARRQMAAPYNRKQDCRARRHRDQARFKTGQEPQFQNPSQQRQKTNGQCEDARRQEAENQNEWIRHTPFFLCNGFHK